MALDAQIWAQGVIRNWTGEYCHLCGKAIPKGEASYVDGQPYCHPSWLQGVTCYMKVSWPNQLYARCDGDDEKAVLPAPAEFLGLSVLWMPTERS